ncbi:insulinase family protein [Pseudocolwellia agarivorans]|uniref:insulinase family protein n=1 Tax=Pseudocolwellia agarivorans TaxID=1911682 RepID=UPI000986B17B|nr:insulinase family protein [Pseudocolwellia agarivorans]
MKKSPNDHKHYLPLTLKNGLRVLLVNNNETKKSAAALAVNAGHFSDPFDRQGLAHFLEHMLFLGTEKYPDGSEYQKFISQHGGSNNAWTATEHTCYFLDINHQYFEEALDRFSQFFTSPLLSETFVQSERENIDAEYKLKLKDDIRRLYDVHKETINQAHPFSKFSVGNHETLADRNNQSIQQEIKAFYKKYYQASAMTLVIEGPQPLNELKALAKSKFSSIPSTQNQINKIEAPLYLPEHQSRLINVYPVKNEHQLIISFAMPAIDNLYRNKPESILAYLLGHEGIGSIYSLLKRKQWAMGLTAGSGINGSNFKDFNISFQLTSIGEKHINDIVAIVFQYIQLMKEKPLAHFYYEEKQTLADIAFQYAEKLKPLDSACQLVVNMQHYPEKDYIFGDYAMDGYCQEEVNNLLQYLSPSNMRIIHISKENTFDQTSKWYGVPYTVSKISDKLLNHWENTQTIDALALPTKNPYIIKNPSVLSNKLTEQEKQSLPSVPTCIDKENGYELWFKQDTTFSVPKGYIYIGIDSPIIIQSDENIAITRLFVDLFTDSVIEKHYDAEIAGIQYHLYAHQGGVTLQLSGFTDKQSHLLARLLKDLKQTKFTENQFSLLKKQLIQHWQNTDTSKSISQLFSFLSSSIQPNNPSCVALANALTKVTYNQFNQFIHKIFEHVSVKSLIHGNWTIKNAEYIGDIIKQFFIKNINIKHSVKPSVISIENHGEITCPIILPKHDHATITYYPAPKKDLTSVAKSMLTSQLLSPLFFQEMRTEKQYGYLVGVNFIPINRYPGIAFYIQSPNTESPHLSGAIDAFINNAYKNIEGMDNEHWEHVKQGLASQLLERDSSLRIKSQRFWAAICTDECNFNQKRQLIDTINNLTLLEIKNFLKETLSTTNSPDRINLLSFTSKDQLQASNIENKDITNTLYLLNNYERKH